MTGRSPLVLVDRSRIVDGRGFCARARLLNYHVGPVGIGIARKATKLPLMTGIGAHEGLAPILEWCRDHDDAVQRLLEIPLEQNEIGLVVPYAVVQGGIDQALRRYARLVQVRGFAHLEQEDPQGVLREQHYLIAGLIWCWVLQVLPEILRRGRIVEVETDDTYVVGCTCGLGDGVLTRADHEERGCQGFGLMCRPDFLVETRGTHELEYHEFKTTGMDHPTFRDKWEVMIQLFAATLDAERRHQRHVQSIYVHGLIKGKRQGDRNPATGRYDYGPIRQQSILCYGYRKPANPPMEREEWAARYDYVDAQGQNRRLAKTYQRTGVWELPEAWIPAGWSKAAFWAAFIGPEVRGKQLVLIGPLSRQTQMVERFTRELVGEETRWQAGLWELYDLGVSLLHEAYGPAEIGEAIDLEALWWETVWPDQRFQDALDRLFPRSYECRRYGARNRCQFEDICLLREGWQNPVGSGRFISRRPHHRDEIEQLEERGVVLPDEGLEDEGEEVEG